jgi:tetratricopeptide (TPR) repeat protein
MSETEGSAAGQDAAAENASRISDLIKAKARKFFEHAKKSAETRNYDYAVNLYADGLALWPDAVEEGLKPLRVVATARKLDGGKPAGFLGARKFPVGGKDVLKSFNNALRLFGLDPTNIVHLQQILTLASRARLARVAAWIAPVLAEAYDTTKKLPESHYAESCAAMAASADLAMAAGDDQVSTDILNANITVAQIWANHHPDSSAAPKARSDASGKLTIVKGQFDRADGFTDSMKDRQSQQALYDREKQVHTSDKFAELIGKARKEWDQNADSPVKLGALVDLMVKTENDQVENEAIALLESEYARSKDYTFKRRADEIRMKQFARQQRALSERLTAQSENAALRQEFVELVRRQSEAELSIFQDRLRQYPTDSMVKYQIGVRLFRLRRFDEAIPFFQQSQADTKLRGQSRLLTGRCFFERGFLDQAVETLSAAAVETSAESGPLGLELNYWCARALEAAGRAGEARKVYGQLIQTDYNYKDARQRLEQLAAAEKKS